MKAIVIDHPGDESVLKIGDIPDPVHGPSDLVIEVHCTALNRADVMQRHGNYPPRPGAPDALGL